MSLRKLQRNPRALDACQGLVLLRESRMRYITGHTKTGVSPIHAFIATQPGQYIFRSLIAEHSYYERTNETVPFACRFSW